MPLTQFASATIGFRSKVLFALLYLLAGYAAWSLGGAGFALAVAVACIPFHVLTLRATPTIIGRLFRGRELTWGEAPRLKGILKILAERADLEHPPRLFLVPGKGMSAFALGPPDNAAIALSRGVVDGLELREIAGVMAHEVTHLSHGDTRMIFLSGLLRRVIGLLALTAGLLVAFNLPLVLLGKAKLATCPLLVLILTPTLGSLLTFALSRRREFSADVGAAELLGDVEPLADALQKMAPTQGNVWEKLFNLEGTPRKKTLLRSHPTSRERIQRLHDLKLEGPFCNRPLFSDGDLQS